MLNRHLIIFTKWPEPDKVKTRLIPKLGSKGAALFHDKLTTYTCSTSLKLSDTQISVYYSGCSESEAANWLGSDFSYTQQSAGDLGCKMLSAFNQSFQSGFESTIIIGTDSPEITPDLLDIAFNCLELSDLVVGPALDGGYYLIGMKNSHKSLFENIEWSTENVLSQTIEKTEAENLDFSFLPHLSDIDTPDDLYIWDKVSSDSQEKPKSRISVIIPALNEENNITDCITSIGGNCEVIVADGGSHDATRLNACKCGAICIPSQPGRGRQMNKGAELATGEILLFLHADTILPEDWEESVLEIAADSNTSIGAFSLKINNTSFKFRIIEKLVSLRNYLFSTPYGDQALFIRKKDFDALGKFKDIPLLEDLALVKNAAKVGKIITSEKSVVTSADRWLKSGTLKRTVINQIILAGYYAGVSPERLAKLY
ncbi:MAG: TIGR04283 family arsenosugar biosynthesis glycosyltransferase [Planctomycetota bacterium]